jgi:integrase
MVPTYKVISRHNSDCPDKDKGQNYIKCDCKKHIAVYDPRISNPIERQSTIPARTRDWQVAERIAVAYRDQHDPDKARAAAAEAALEAERNRQKTTKTIVTIEEAVGRFLQYEHDNPNRKHSHRSGKAASKTMGNYQGLLGAVIRENGEYIVKRPGRLFSWLDTLSPRPKHISDLTSILVDDFRASWNASIPKFNGSKPLNDLSIQKAFTRLKAFFEYCKNRGEWISQNPLNSVPTPTVEEGYRTAPFTSEQYDSIVAAIKRRYPAAIETTPPENLSPEDKKQYSDAHRVLAIVELMRWSGMALADAVQFELSSIKNGSGHVIYRRVKTNTKAEPTLLPRVVTMLREVVPIDADPNRPFYDKDIKPETNRGYWSLWIKETFAEAGITSVETELRDREPHAHMLRDTFAVGQMIMQKKLGIVDIDSIAKAMGDSATTIRKHYAPWVKELEDAHREMQQRIVDAQAQEEADKQPQQPKVVNIAGGRK